MSETVVEVERVLTDKHGNVIEVELVICVPGRCPVRRTVTLDAE